MDTPTLPSAKPPRPVAISLIAASTALLIVGVGLGASATGVYMRRADRRLAQNEQLASITDNAQIRQHRAQLERGYDAPVWVSNDSYDPTVQYTLEGTRKTEVPVLLGREFDTAVCIGTIGPDGFVQNPNSPLCLGY